MFNIFIQLVRGCYHTIGVVGVNVGIWSVPALNGSIHSSTKALFSITAHYHTQNCPPTQERRGLTPNTNQFYSRKMFANIYKKGVRH